jgi:threonine dehydrogenase-like Zn-dependent dehydrogenase
MPNACLTVFSAPVPGFSNTPGIFRDGALAQYIVIPDYMVYQGSSQVPWHHLAITETVACAVNALRKADPQMGETVVVLGAGPVGLLLISMLKTSGCRVIASETAPHRANVAKKIGADVIVNPETQDLREVVKAQTNGRGADVTVEAVGPLLNECIELARFGGRVVLFGHDELARPQVPQALIMRKELQISGVFLTKYTFVPAIKLLERGMLPMDDVVSHVMPLEQIFEAHRMMRAKEGLKVVIDPSKNIRA